MPLDRPVDALVARLALINDAKDSIDAQYYQWNSDAVGYAFLSSLIAAADRGVSVRLLVDDMKLRSRSKRIASQCLHPNLDIRVFNPWTSRSGPAMQALEFVRRFRKLDHRMHNKLLVTDGEQAIFGGRNIGAEHFGLNDDFNVVDFDVLLSGASVVDLSAVFDDYWNSSSAVPGSTLDSTVSESDLDAVRVMVAEELRVGEPDLAAFREEEARWNKTMATNIRGLADGAVHVIADTPSVSGTAERTQVISVLRRLAGSATKDLVIVTPFFVPSDADIQAYEEIVAQGVRVRLLTNSLASNPGTISNSGFKRHRLAIVRAGVELHELRPDAAVKPMWETPPCVGRYLGLHAKMFIIDRETIFLGSVNLDPRSKYVNTEMGVHIRDSTLAEECADRALSLMVPENAWTVRIGADGRLRWSSDQGDLRRQPARRVGQRVADWIFGLLPIRNYV